MRVIRIDEQTACGRASHVEVEMGMGAVLAANVDQSLLRLTFIPWNSQVTGKKKVPAN